MPLALTLRPGDKVQIGPGIEIEVGRLRPGDVRLHIDAKDRRVERQPRPEQVKPKHQDHPEMC